ncbi:MAG: ABC-F family ATP-binding cassette domain-containing protein, partial [Myxococcales bacterium]|nr:ABC-F family ATP-binding cassette domain-containing protein [Myxococcales bacterium]
MLQVAGLRFGYTHEPLFEDVTFVLNTGERAGLVAPNGAGKTTLLRILAGELAPDAGTVQYDKEAGLSYYRQSHELGATGTVAEALLSGFGELLALRDELHAAQEAAASGTERALATLAHAMERYHVAGGDEVERRVAMVAQHLGFGDRDLARPIAGLSGGERGRLRLGICLTKPAGLMLFDEPTNHLDLETIAWLEDYLNGQSAAQLIVSHDRAFLDNVTTQTMELGRKSFRVYSLPYSEYAVARAADLERERELAERQQSFVQKTEDFIRRNIAGQKTKQAQSRRKMLDKLERVDRPEDVWQRAARVRFRFVDAPRSGDIVLDCHGLAASRGGRRLFGPFDLLVRRGDRVGVIGPNGTGKTTLLKLLSGQGAPEDRGEVKRGANLASGYYDQHLGSLEERRSAIEEVRSVRGDFNDDGARAYLARFRFYGDDPFRRVASFSGGERSRLALAKLLLHPMNLLFLDEPTNHLDMPAAEILEEALCGFEGSVVFVSHDRRFLETVSTRIVAMHEGGIDLYEGNYRDYVEQTRRAAAPAQSVVKGRAPAPAAARASSRPAATPAAERAASQAGQGAAAPSA